MSARPNCPTFPPFRAGTVQSDQRGNAWILPTSSTESKKGELVYDVVNNHGVLIERVRLPLGRSLAGFAADRSVFLTSPENKSWLLERYKLQ